MVKTITNEAKKFETELENIFYHRSLPTFNKIVGLKGNDQFSLGMFLKLGVKFNITEIEDENSKDYLQILETEKAMNENKIFSSGAKDMIFVVSRLGAYVKFGFNGKQNAVNIDIKFKGLEEKEKIVEFFKSDMGIVYLVFVYLHEVQHILRKHTTKNFDALMMNIIRKHLGNTPQNQFHHNLINIAEDYAINYSIFSYIESSRDYRVFLPDIKSAYLYDKKYEEAQNSEMEILEDLLNQSKDLISKMKQIGSQNFITDKDGNNKPFENHSDNFKADKDGNEQNGKSDEENEDGNGNYNYAEEMIKDQLAQGLANSLEEQIAKQKGNESFKLNSLIENSTKTNVMWFDRLKTNYYNIVNRRTKKYTSNWSNLNAKMRHIYKSPRRVNLEETLDIVLSIDNSGSMSIESLSKMLYIIEQKVKKINKLTVLAHDTDIVGILENEKNPKTILDFVKKRHGGGGTSHKAVFNYLDNNKKKLGKNVIYISFSDNYSDIETEYFKYNFIQKVDKIWLNSDGKSVDKKVAGLKIDIE